MFYFCHFFIPRKRHNIETVTCLKLSMYVVFNKNITFCGLVVEIPRMTRIFVYCWSNMKVWNNNNHIFYYFLILIYQDNHRPMLHVLYIFLNYSKFSCMCLYQPVKFKFCWITVHINLCTMKNFTPRVLNSNKRLMNRNIGGFCILSKMDRHKIIRYIIIQPNKHLFIRFIYYQSEH